MKKGTAVLCMIFLLAAIVLPAGHAASAGSARPLRVWFSHIEPENETLRTLAGEFTRETGIQVEVISRRAIFDAPADLVNYATLDNRPDIVFMQAPDIGGLVASGYLQALEIGEDLRERYVDTAFDAFTINGVTYGAGYSIDASGLIYNKDLIGKEQLPQTWEEFFELSEQLTLRDDQGNIIRRGTLLNSRDMWFNYPIIREFGGYYYGVYPDGTYNPYDIGLDNEGMLAYVNKIKELMGKGLVLESQIAGESNIVAGFGKGEVAMILYGLWSAKYFQDMGVNYGIAPLPAHSDGTPSKPLATVQGFVINSYTQNLDGANAFLEFMLRDDPQQALTEAGNGGAAKTGERNPANISVMNSDYIRSDELLSMLSIIGAECEPFPNIPEGPIWYNYTTSTFRTIFFGDSSGREVDARVRLKELADAIRRDVELLNYTAEKIEIPWWVYPAIGLFIILIIVILALWRAARNRKNPLYIKYEYDKKITLLSWGLLLPLLLLIGLFYVYPIIHNVYLSLTDYSGINLKDYGIIGFANYRDIFVAGIDGLISMTLWTVIFAVTVVGLSFICGTYVATILDNINFRIAKIFRLVFILPWVIPTVITLLMWQGLLETDGGLVNQLFSIIGLPAVPWLSNPVWAKISTILVMTWFSFPYFMIVAFGLLKSIPKDYYEAARIDGAGNGYIFFRIILPLLFKALVPTIIMAFIMQFNQFGVYLLTQGGPPSDTLGAPGATDLLITYVFNQAFNTKRFAVAAAYAVIIFIFVGTFSLLAMKLSNKRMES